MGKNMSAKECNVCGNLIYYGGNCNCSELKLTRIEAESYIEAYYKQGMEIKDLFKHIWHASTTILPNLEVQVVIDSNDAIHISTGSSGYVDFAINPVGMKLPIKCWIHTHPFGAAYFSGTDWKTVNTWLPLMETAYVLGGVNHNGYWQQSKPYELEIINGDEITIQNQIFSQGDEQE